METRLSSDTDGATWPVYRPYFLLMMYEGGAWFGLLQWNSSRFFKPPRVKNIGLQNQGVQETEGKNVVFG